MRVAWQQDMDFGLLYIINVTIYSLKHLEVYISFVLQ